MLFLFSLLIAAAFSVFCGKAIRKHPAPFYLAAAVLSIGTTILANVRISEIPAFVQQNIIALFTKGILAAAFWAVVMWTGALPNGSSMMKRLMPQRGQLSIFAAILTLGHAVGLGISMLPRWVSKADVLNLTVCIALMLIMLPLTVISVQKIRRKMKAKSWKSVQRWAYLFYALIPVHVIVLNIAKARSGKTGVLFSLIAYLAVFLGYAVCRLRKYYLAKKKPERRFGVNAAACCAFLLGTAVFLSAAYPQKQAEPVQSGEAEVREESSQTDSEAAATTTALTQISETVAASGTTATETAVTENTAAATGEDSTAETTSTDTASETPEDSQPAEQAETPVDQPAETEPPAPARVYQDGTFTASAYGYDGDITVHVTIQDDRITDITAETAESDDSYFADAKNVVIPAIIRSQAADVDACSGATYSSNGIMTAVRAALESAKI